MEDEAVRKETLAKGKSDQWQMLRIMINTYVEHSIADSWKGGGDPHDVPVIEAQLKLIKAQLMTHIDKMKREFGT